MTRLDLAYLFALVLIAGLAICVGMIWYKNPKSDGNWKAPLAKVATFSATPSTLVRLKNFRAFEFSANDKYSQDWRNIEIDPSTIKEMWYFFEPFRANAVFAHSFISFVFQNTDGSTQSLAISIEARMEKAQSYSPVSGLFRNYELLYVWSTEKDIMSRIGVSLDHTLYAYQLNLTPDQQRTLFDYFVSRTNTLEQRPRFYNTLHSNCTNELAKAVNEAFPDALPWHRSWVFTGRSAKWLADLGFINLPTGTTFKETMAGADIRQIVQTHANEPATIFDDRWRQALKAAQANKNRRPGEELGGG